jgi:stearoyl-CoA desaturase (delta-9 desaturase)
MLKFIKNAIKGQNSVSFQTATILVMLLTATSGYVVDFSWSLLAVTGFMYVMTIGVGVSVTYHRYLTHRSFTMHPVLSYVTILTHRMHHANSDKERDPHPPAKVLNTLFGRYTRVDLNGINRLVRDPFNKFLHQYYFAILAAYGAVWAAFGIEYFYYGFVFPIFVAVVASNLLNLLGHSVKILGYRSYATSDKSSNNPVMGYLGFGEGWHNNHHKFPGSARFGLKRYELDLGYLFIKLCERIGLVTKVKVANSN